MSIFNALQNIFRLGISVSGERGNQVELPATKGRGQIKISARSVGNLIRFGRGCRFEGKIAIQGNNNRVIIGDRARMRRMSIRISGDGHTIEIGDDCTALGMSCICKEGCGIRIGNGFLAAKGTSIQTSDSHSIIDVATGKRTNPAAAVTIGDHVWIGRHVAIWKGASIPSNCVVAAHAFVNRSFDEEMIVVGGVPARIIKRGVNWDVRRL